MPPRRRGAAGRREGSGMPPQCGAGRRAGVVPAPEAAQSECLLMHLSAHRGGGAMCGYWLGRRLRVVGLSIVVVCGCNHERTTTEPARTPDTPTDSIERVARILVSQPPDGFTV